MAQCLGRLPAMGHRPKEISVLSEKRTRSLKLGIRSCHVQPENAQKVLLVAEVKKRLDKEHSSLPLGKHGRDDEEMIFWFLKDRRFSVEEAVFKLSKAIAWRQEFGVSSLSAENIKRAAETGKAYVHEQLDIHDRPVLIVTVAKHFPGEVEVREDEELCTFLIEKALSKLPSGKDEILVLIDLRGFKLENADIKFTSFVFDAFHYYYPRRLGEVLFVDAPFIFKPVWQLIKPLLRSYASLAKFCTATDVKEKYFTTQTTPPGF